MICLPPQTAKPLSHYGSKLGVAKITIGNQFVKGKILPKYLINSLYIVIGINLLASQATRATCLWARAAIR